MTTYTQHEAFSFITNQTARERLMQSYDRIQRSYNELLSGYELRPEEILNDVLHVSDFNGIVEVCGIHYYTFCEHHFAPFFGIADVYYMPGEIITGLGKIVRLVRDVHARRLQIQETMTKDIAEDISRILMAKGVFVRTSAKHLCVCSRGPSDDGAETVVTYGIGSLSELVLNINKG